MENLKRYRIASYDDGYPAFVDPEGEWVKFSDIKDILKTTHQHPQDKTCETCGRGFLSPQCGSCGPNFDWQFWTQASSVNYSWHKGNGMSKKKVNYFLVRYRGGDKEVMPGSDVSLLQQSGGNVKVIKRVPKDYIVNQQTNIGYNLP
jgi:hypothetical protein